MSNSHPLLMSGAMVRATLAGLKSQTRRIPGPTNSLIDGSFWSAKNHIWQELDFGNAWVDPGPSPAGNPGPYLKVPRPKMGTVHRVYPKYAVGGTVWVRESMYLRDCDDCGAWRYSADNEIVTVSRADESAMLVWAHHKQTCHCPSIHMPRWASRILLRITDIRVQRVQDITEEDAIAEGVELKHYTGLAKGTHCPSYVGAFSSLWDEININRGYGWDENPWCWCLTFERVEATP